MLAGFDEKSWRLTDYLFVLGSTCFVLCFHFLLRQDSPSLTRRVGMEVNEIEKWKMKKTGVADNSLLTTANSELICCRP